MKDLNTVYAERIASEYAQKPASKLVALKKLDRRAKLPANIFAYTFGVLGALVLGIGMCLSMGVVGKSMAFALPLGVVIGLAGIAMVSVNYPFYKRLLAKGKEKYAFEIMALAQEISAEEA